MDTPPYLPSNFQKYRPDSLNPTIKLSNRIRGSSYRIKISCTHLYPTPAKHPTDTLKDYNKTTPPLERTLGVEFESEDYKPKETEDNTNLTNLK